MSYNRQFMMLISVASIVTLTYAGHRLGSVISPKSNSVAWNIPCELCSSAHAECSGNTPAAFQPGQCVGGGLR